MGLRLSEYSRLNSFININLKWNKNFQKIAKRINIRRNSFFKKTAGNLYVGGFWGEKSRDANGFSI